MNRLVEVFCATQRHQKTKKQKKRNADKGSHGFTHRDISRNFIRARNARSVRVQVGNGGRL